MLPCYMMNPLLGHRRGSIDDNKAFQTALHKPRMVQQIARRKWGGLSKDRRFRSAKQPSVRSVVITWTAVAVVLGIILTVDIPLPVDIPKLDGTATSNQAISA